MSGWKLVTKELHRRGGKATHIRQFDAAQHKIAVTRAINLGLIAHPTKRAEYSLTQKGLDWCEGRIKYEYHGQQTKHRFV